MVRYLFYTIGDLTYQSPLVAFQLAFQNKIPNPFSTAKGAAGKDWFKRFMKWHGDKLSLRQPKGTSTATARNKWRFSSICTKKSLLLMITHLHVFST